MDKFDSFRVKAAMVAASAVATLSLVACSASADQRPELAEKKGPGIVGACAVKVTSDPRFNSAWAVAYTLSQGMAIGSFGLLYDDLSYQQGMATAGQEEYLLPGTYFFIGSDACISAREKGIPTQPIGG